MEISSFQLCRNLNADWIKSNWIRLFEVISKKWMLNKTIPEILFNIIKKQLQNEINRKLNKCSERSEVERFIVSIFFIVIIAIWEWKHMYIKIRNKDVSFSSYGALLTYSTRAENLLMALSIAQPIVIKRFIELDCVVSNGKSTDTV